MFKLRVFSLFFLLFAISLFIYVFYKSEIINDGLKHYYYFKYYVISTFILILSILFFFLKNKLKEKFIISFGSLIFSFYFIEIIFQISENKKKSNMSRFDKSLMEEYKKNNPKFVTYIAPSNFLSKKNKYLPFSGVSLKKTFLCDENGYLAHYRSDRYGFNNPDKNWDSKIEFLLLGDSFVHGACVNEEDTFRSQIEKLLSGKKFNNVISLGYSGTGPLIQLATLREYYSKVKPKTIIWFYFEGNDINDFIQENNNMILKKYLNDQEFKQNLNNQQKILDEKLLRYLKKEVTNKRMNIFRRSVENFIKLQLTRNFLEGFLHKRSGINQIPNDYERVLKNMIEFVEKNNSSLYFVYVPSKSRYMNPKLNTSELFNYGKLIELVKSNNINLIDLNIDFFSKEKNPLSFYPAHRDGGHFNEFGYKKISKFLINSIISNSK